MKCRLFRALSILTGLVFFFGNHAIRADYPYREHRFDSFVTLPPCNDDDILFVGNSITNMMNWWEAFGSRDNIRGRGNSGATSSELLDYFNQIVKGNPSKVFLMIGTNDLGSDQPKNRPDSVASRIVEFLSRTRAKLPEAEIYFQSILPSRVGLRTPEKTELTNLIVKEHIDALHDDKMTYIDLYTVFKGDEGELKMSSATPDGEALSFDGLHLTQQGYKLWLDIIKDYVGYEPAYVQQAPNIWGGMQGSEGMRVSYFGALPVKNTDILLFGDEMIHNGEWQERLGCTAVKDRGIGWGFPGMSLQQMEGTFADILKGNIENGVTKETPKAVALYGGVYEIQKGWNADSLFKSFSQAVSTLRELLPETPVYVMSLLPFPKGVEGKNNEIKEFNRMLSDNLVKPDNGIHLIDLFAIAGGVDRDETMFMNEKSTYLSGDGYSKVAAEIASALSPLIKED